MSKDKKDYSPWLWLMSVAVLIACVTTTILRVNNKQDTVDTVASDVPVFTIPTPAEQAAKLAAEREAEIHKDTEKLIENLLRYVEDVDFKKDLAKSSSIYVFSSLGPQELRSIEERFAKRGWQLKFMPEPDADYTPFVISPLPEN